MSDGLRDYITEEIRSIDSSIKDISNKINELDKTLVEYKVSFEHHIGADENMHSELKRMNNILAENTESLKYHIRRTDLLESNSVTLANRLSELEIKSIEANAIKQWISSQTKMVGKIIASLVTLGTLASYIPDLLKWLTK